MFLRGWSWTTCVGATPGLSLTGTFPGITSELWSQGPLGGGQNVTPPSLGDASAGAARVILLNELNGTIFYF